MVSDQPSALPSEHIVAAVVSYNRRDLLLEALNGITSQEPPPDRVLVVDNASSDDSVTAVRSSFPDVEVIELSINTGGAGGFAVALDAALAHDASLIWLLDDDAIPRPGALRALRSAHTHYPGAERPAAVASRVVWIDGATHPMNIPRRVLAASTRTRSAAEEIGCSPIRSTSFCSILIDAAAAREEELPLAAYFIWNDDVEYTARLLRSRVGLLCPDSVVVHKTADFHSSGSAPGGRFFYDVRNAIWMLTRSRGLRAGERAYYAFATLARWARTMRNASDRRTLLRVGRQGLAAARRAPEDTDAVLRGVWNLTSSPRGRPIGSNNDHRRPLPD